MEQMLRCKNLVCIGGGVGVTPFMSYLKYLLYVLIQNIDVSSNKPQYSRENEKIFRKLEQLKFVWLCPDPIQLLWFAWTISSLHNAVSLNSKSLKKNNNL
jgi:hypothetical protein